jgi:uncharacterized metal-binding protein YceD (DUF177 family)
MTDIASNSREPQAGLVCRLEIAELPVDGLSVELVAEEAERIELAQRMGIPEIKVLTATMHVVREQGGATYCVEGRLRAQLVQTCVVTLEPLEIGIDVPIFVRFAETDDVKADDIDWDLLPDDEDMPESITDGVIDLGDLAAEQLALEIDPFPRTPDLPYQDHSSDDGSDEENPFSALAALRDKLPK